MATIAIILQCKNPFSNTFKCLLQAENSMTGRVYVGEVLHASLAKNEWVIGQINKWTKREFENFLDSLKLLQAVL